MLDLAGAVNSVVENASLGTVVGITANAFDSDATTNVITYSLTDNDGGRFAIDANTGVVTVAGAIDRETDGVSRSITVRATSADTSYSEQSFSIGIVDADEFNVTAPVDNDGTSNNVDENVSIGTVVGIQHKLATRMRQRIQSRIRCLMTTVVVLQSMPIQEL